MTATRSDFQVHQMSQKGKKFNEKMFQTSLIESSKWLQTIYAKKYLLIWHNMGMKCRMSMYVPAQGINLLVTMVVDKQIILTHFGDINFF